MESILTPVILNKITLYRIIKTILYEFIFLSKVFLYNCTFFVFFHNI